MVSKRRKGTTAKRDIGQEIIDGLGTFAEALKKGDDIAARFTCRKVVLDIVPSDYPPKRVRQVRAALGLSQALVRTVFGGLDRYGAGMGARGQGSGEDRLPIHGRDTSRSRTMAAEGSPVA